MSQKAIFLDRDDTLIEDYGYINDPAQVRLLDGVAESLKELRLMGYKLVVVSNQSGVARGILTEKTLGEIHCRLEHLLIEKGAHLDKIYYCPYHPEGSVKKYREESEDRKPNPGMLLKASEELDIARNKSWMVGNSQRDIEAGQRADCKTILLDNPEHTKNLEPAKIKPDFNAINMKEVVNIIKKQERSASKILSQAAPVPAVNISRQETQKIQPETQTEPESQTESQEEPKGQPKQTTEQILADILVVLKRNQRQESFDEFSIMRMLAGFVQVLVLLCLVVSVILITSPNKQHNAVIISLGFAGVLQLMALTFYTIQKQK